MSIFRSASLAIQGVFNTVTSVANTAEETVSMGTEFIHNRAHAQKLTDKQNVIMDTAKALKVFKDELDKDGDLKAMYDELEKDWG